MFGLGFWEIVVIVLLLLLVVGPSRVGPLARSLGRAMREIRKGLDEFRETFGVEDGIRDIEAVKSEIVETIEAEADGAVTAKPGPDPGPPEDGGRGHG